jgi:hypothetical protein
LSFCCGMFSDNCNHVWTTVMIKISYDPRHQRGVLFLDTVVGYIKRTV